MIYMNSNCSYNYGPNGELNISCSIPQQTEQFVDVEPQIEHFAFYGPTNSKHSECGIVTNTCQRLARENTGTNFYFNENIPYSVARPDLEMCACTRDKPHVYSNDPKNPNPFVDNIVKINNNHAFPRRYMVRSQNGSAAANCNTHNFYRGTNEGPIFNRSSEAPLDIGDKNCTMPLSKNPNPLSYPGAPNQLAGSKANAAQKKDALDKYNNYFSDLNNPNTSISKYGWN